MERLGQLAQEHNETIRLVLVGGAVMVLVYGARQSTRDVDAAILTPPEASRVANLPEWLLRSAAGRTTGSTTLPKGISLA